MTPDPFGPWSPRRRWLWGGLAFFTCLVFGPKFVIGLRPPSGLILDFFQEYASARNVREGLPAYTDQAVTVPRYLGLEPDLEHFFIRFNAHPPPSVLLPLPLAGLDYPDAFLAWSLLSLAALALSLGLIARQLRVTFSPWSLCPLAVILLLANPVRQQFNQGQLNAFLLLLVTACWAAERSGRPGWASLFLGLATALKLFPGLLFLYFLARRQWRVFAVGLAAFLAITALALAVLGTDAYADYFGRVLPHLGVYQEYWLNASIHGFWHKLFVGQSGHTQPLWTAPLLAHVGAATSCALVVAVLLYFTNRARTRREHDTTFGLAVQAMLLVSPLTWDHYLLLLVLPLALLWLHGDPRWHPLITVFFVALCLSPRFVWNLTVHGPGEGEGQTASALQTLGPISYLFYAQLALFLLAVVGLPRRQSSKET